MKIIAEDAKGELYTSLALRMQSTVPGASGDQASIALNESRRSILETLLTPWREPAKTFERVVAIARANGEDYSERARRNWASRQSTVTGTADTVVRRPGTIVLRLGSVA